MVDPADAIGKARAAVTERAELPGMSLMEHLEELRKRFGESFRPQLELDYIERLLKDF